MRNKTIFITILFCILFSISSYANEDIFYTATKNVSSIEEKQNIIKIIKIALFNENISDTIEPKVLYTQNNSLKASQIVRQQQITPRFPSGRKRAEV